MKNTFCSLFLLSFFFLSGHGQDANPPSWINSPDKYCFYQSEICAVGIGQGPMQAEMKARSEISKVIMTKIKVHDQYKKNIITNREIGSTAFESNKDEVFSSSLDESTEGDLVGVEIRKRYEDKSHVYIFAVLNKLKMAESIKLKISKLDRSIKEEWQRGEDASLFLLKRNFNLRENYNQKYYFLVNRKIPVIITKNQIDELGKINKVLKFPIVLNIGNSIDIYKVKFRDYLETVLLAKNYVVKKKVDTSKPHIIIELNPLIESKFFNVKGFEKYQFHLSLKSSWNNGKLLGNASTTTTHTGRNKEQAVENAFPVLRTWIENHLHLLKL